MYRHEISRYLTEVCGAKQQIMVKRCNRRESLEEHRAWLFSLAMNYDIYRGGMDPNKPLSKYREMAEKVFGSLKKVM